MRWTRRSEEEEKEEQEATERRNENAEINRFDLMVARDAGQGEREMRV